MGRLRSWLARPWAALRRRVRRRAKPARSTRPARPHRPEPTPQQLTLMQAALCQVLDHDPNVRRVLPALAALERVLPAGSRALERLPVRWLRDASARLDVLVGDWSSDGLRQLREYLRGLCESRAARALGSAAPPANPLQPEVSETSLSQFLEASEMLDPAAAKPALAPATARMRTQPRD